MDQLACEETERDKRLYKEYGRRRETAIREKASKVIQQYKIFRIDPTVLSAKRECVSEAASYAAP